MKFLNIIALVAFLSQSATIAASQVDCPDTDDDNPHFENPCENEVDEFDRTPAPTVKPTPSPTSSPTTLSPTGSPDCESTDGVFGAMDGATSVVVGFSYEVEVSGEESDDSIEDSILPPLEKAIVDSILPALFKDECDKSARRLRFQRRLEVVGLSKYPSDYIYDDLICGTFDEGNSCVVVSGEMTIYSDDDESASTEMETVKNAVKAAMDSGSLDDSHEDIIKVTYVDIEPNTNNGNSATGTDYGSIDKNTLAYAIAGAILGALLILAVVYRQKNKGGKDEDTTNTPIGAGSEASTEMETVKNAAMAAVDTGSVDDSHGDNLCCADPRRCCE